MLKRSFDAIVSGVSLLLLGPLFLLIALAIKAESKGPVFYRGERVGRNGRIFRIYKFRSMIVDAERRGGSSTSDQDPRVTKVGSIVRRYKLDELSQLINVFLGDMSLVGPRPQVKWAVETYSDEEKRVLSLRPGITDRASIKFHNEGEIIARSGISDPDEAYLKLIHPEKMRLQLAYLRERSFFGDLRILYDTITTLFVTRMTSAAEQQLPGNADPGDKG